MTDPEETITKLRIALQNLAYLRATTERTCEDAYQAMFKLPEAAVWDAAQRVLDETKDSSAP